MSNIVWGYDSRHGGIFAKLLPGSKLITVLKVRKEKAPKRRKTRDDDGDDSGLTMKDVGLPDREDFSGGESDDDGGSFVEDMDGVDEVGGDDPAAGLDEALVDGGDDCAGDGEELGGDDDPMASGSAGDILSIGPLEDAEFCKALAESTIKACDESMAVLASRAHAVRHGLVGNIAFTDPELFGERHMSLVQYESQVHIVHWSRFIHQMQNRFEYRSRQLAPN